MRSVLVALALGAMFLLPVHSVASLSTPLDPVLDPDAATRGAWGPVLSWPVQGEDAALLPTGEVLVFAYGADAHLFDPETGALVAVPTPPESSINCAGLALMPDGRVMVNGGHSPTWHGTRPAWIFDAADRSWTQAPDMVRGRYYPATIALADGRMLTVSGNDETGGDATTAESFDGEAWTEWPASELWMEFYPRLHVLPDGDVVRVGQDPRAAFLDVESGAWTEGPESNYGLRWGGASVLLPGLDRVLVFGGGSMGASSEGAGPVPVMRDDAAHLEAHLLGNLEPGASPATERAEILDLSGDEPQWRETAPMTDARRDHQGVLLADGTVLAVGGAYGFEMMPGWAEHALSPELYDPEAEAWTLMAPADRHRGYHSTSILLPDGRVLVSGGDFETGVGSVPGSSRTAQVFSPPYLFRGERPVIERAPTDVAYESTFVVRADEAATDVARVTLVRLSSVTHSLNTDQRLLDLAFERSGPELVVRAPETGGEAPPGYYMLFLLSEEGVPSVASILRLE